jgi:hypothetical protein
MSGRATITIAYHGLTRSIRQWADFLGLDYYTLAARIRRGWSVERAVESPGRHHGRGPKTHGQSYSKEHRAWKAMLGRCYYPGYHAAHRYGGRGLTVCERWRDSFETFFADLGPCPSPDFSLGRIDNAKGYCPANCRWENRQQQAASRDKPRRI